MFEIEDVRYYDATSAAAYLHISRNMFYANVRFRIKAYRFGGRKHLLYKEADLAAFRTVEIVSVSVVASSCL